MLPFHLFCQSTLRRKKDLLGKEVKEAKNWGVKNIAKVKKVVESQKVILPR
jgi:hypothetical protein